VTSDSSRCPAWCTNDDCDGHHAGETVTAAEGLSITYGADVAFLVTGYHDEADELPPTVYLAGGDPQSDLAVELSPAQARRLGDALVATADLVEPPD
jgi:hypothetical protein